MLGNIPYLEKNTNKKIQNVQNYLIFQRKKIDCRL